MTLIMCNVCILVLSIILISVLSYMGWVAYRMDRRHKEFDVRARKVIELLAPCIHRIPPDTLIHSLKSQGVDLDPDIEERLRVIYHEAIRIEDDSLLEEQESCCHCRKNEEEGS